MKNTNTISVSDSLVGSICKEIEFIKQRSKAINASLANCNDQSLKERLLNELKTHNIRKKELFSITSLLSKKQCQENLSSLFLLELLKRA